MIQAYMPHAHHTTYYILTDFSQYGMPSNYTMLLAHKPATIKYQWMIIPLPTISKGGDKYEGAHHKKDLRAFSV